MSLVPQYVAHGAGSVQPGGAYGNTAQPFYCSQDTMLLQQQQAAAACAAASGTCLQVQPRVPAGSAVLVGMCSSSSTGFLCGPVSSQLYSTAASNTSGSMLGSCVLLSAPGTAAACLDRGTCPVSAAQHFAQPVFVAVVPAQGAQLEPVGFPAHLSAPVSVVPSAMLPVPQLSAGPGGYGSSMGNQGACAEPTSSSSGGLVSGPQVTGSDIASVAAAVAQDKLAQMQQLEVMQQQLKRDVVTLLPYLEPAWPIGG